VVGADERMNALRATPVPSPNHQWNIGDGYLYPGETCCRPYLWTQSELHHRMIESTQKRSIYMPALLDSSKVWSIVGFHPGSVWARFRADPIFKKRAKAHTFEI
jgi:hypothetical protein